MKSMPLRPLTLREILPAARLTENAAISGPGRLSRGPRRLGSGSDLSAPYPALTATASVRTDVAEGRQQRKVDVLSAADLGNSPIGRLPQTW